MAYTTKGNVQRYLNVDISSSFDSQITDWISAVTSWIERYVGKSFEASSDETRHYDGNGKRVLEIDPVTDTPTTVQLLDQDGTVDVTLTEGASNEYLLYPLNETPKYELHLTNYSSRSVFPHRERSVLVTAKFGHSESVPEDIELVATKLVGEIVKEGLKGGKLASVTLGDYQASFQRVNEKADALGVYQVLDMYRDIEL